MKNYDALKIQVVTLAQADVITSSQELNDVTGNDIYNGFGD